MKEKFSIAHKDEAMLRLIKNAKHKTLAIWAIDCAERVLPYFEEKNKDNRPRKAIDTLKEWIDTGVFKMAVIRKASLDSHAAARELEDSPAKSAARAAGQAVAAAHVPRHAYGSAVYAQQAIYRATNSLEAAAKERDWQYQHLLILFNKENKSLFKSFINQTAILEPMPKTKKQKSDVIKAYLAEERVITESSDAARELFNQSSYGTLDQEGKLQLSLLEALYLMEKGKIKITSKGNRAISSKNFIAKAREVEPNFWVRYCVFKDFRERGYIIKTALKFGADFRVYDRGIKPGQDHAKWIVFPVHEGSTLTWHDFAAKNRVAHSTKKRLLIAIVDEETSVTFYEVRWVRP
jgi:tRNA-intron endonuclease